MTQRRLASDFLDDIRKASEKAPEFLGGLSLAAFAADEKTAYAVIRALEIVGEATKRVPGTLRDRYPQIPWRAMAGIRDKLSHDYQTVNLEVVWRSVTEDLPVLLPELRRMLEEIRKEEGTT